MTVDGMRANLHIQLTAGLLLVGLVGCADGPWPYLVSSNPMVRRQWEDDERLRPTMYTQLAELEAIRETAEGMTPQEQQHWADQIAELLEHETNPRLRTAAIETAAELPVEAATQLLSAEVKNEHAVCRIAACRAWGRRGGPAAAVALAGVLGSDTDVDVRMAAARELGRFSDPQAIKALGMALEDQDPALQYCAMQSLKASSGRDFGNSVSAWREFAAGGNPDPPPSPSMAQRLRELF